MGRRWTGPRHPGPHRSWGLCCGHWGAATESGLCFKIMFNSNEVTVTRSQGVWPSSSGRRGWGRGSGGLRGESGGGAGAGLCRALSPARAGRAGRRKHRRRAGPTGRGLSPGQAKRWLASRGSPAPAFSVPAFLHLHQAKREPRQAARVRGGAVRAAACCHPERPGGVTAAGEALEARRWAAAHTRPQSRAPGNPAPTSPEA